MLTKLKDADVVIGCYDYDNSNGDVYNAFLKMCADDRLEPIIFRVSDSNGMDSTSVWAQTQEEFAKKLQTDVDFNILHAELKANLNGVYVYAYFNFDDKYIYVGGDSTEEFVDFLREYIE